MSNLPTLNIELTPRGQLPVVPSFGPLPPVLRENPFGLDGSGKHIKDIRGVVIKPVIETMLSTIEKRGMQEGHFGTELSKIREDAFETLVLRLNSHISNSLYHVTPSYLLNEGHLYSYEFNAYLHHICNEMAATPHYFYEIGLRIIPDSMSFLFKAATIRQIYTTIAKIGSRFSEEKFDTLDANDHSIVIQRRTPVTFERLGEVPWLVHIASGCQTLRGALASIPNTQSGAPNSEIEERKCILRGDDCCEWKFIWQAPNRKKWFGWF